MLKSDRREIRGARLVFALDQLSMLITSGNVIH